MTALCSHLRITNAIAVDDDNVDDDIDIDNSAEVEWAVATRFQADKDLVLVPGSVGFVLDPSQGATRGLAAAFGMDATKPVGEPYPEVPYPPQATTSLVECRWEEYGLKRKC